MKLHLCTLEELRGYSSLKDEDKKVVADVWEGIQENIKTEEADEKRKMEEKVEKRAKRAAEAAEETEVGYYRPTLA